MVGILPWSSLGPGLLDVFIPLAVAVNQNKGEGRCWAQRCKCFSGNTTCTQLQPADLNPSLCTAGRQLVNRAPKQVSSLKTKPAPSYSQPGARKGKESKAWSKRQVQNGTRSTTQPPKGACSAEGLPRRLNLLVRNNFKQCWYYLQH